MFDLFIECADLREKSLASVPIPKMRVSQFLPLSIHEAELPLLLVLRFNLNSCLAATKFFLTFPSSFGTSESGECVPRQSDAIFPEPYLIIQLTNS
jgi:hypothetical protein